MSNDPKWLNKSQVARRLSMANVESFKGFWAGLQDVAESGGQPSVDGRALGFVKADGEWMLSRNDLPVVEAATVALCAPKGDAWMDGPGLRMHVPSDCEAIAKRLWNQVVAFAAQARQVSVEGTRLVVERRSTERGAEPCLSTDSLPLFMRAVRNAKNRQVEASVARLLEEEGTSFRM